MKRSRFSEEQSVEVLKSAESGAPVDELLRVHGISRATFYNWRKKYGSLEIDEASRLKRLEDENRQLKRVYRIYRAEGLQLPKRRRERMRSAKRVSVDSGRPARRALADGPRSRVPADTALLGPEYARARPPASHSVWPLGAFGPRGADSV